MPQSAAQRVRPGAEPFRFGTGSTGALLLHGFTGSPASLRPLGESLGAAGVTAVGPLLPGHGTSDWNDLGLATVESWRETADGGLEDLASCDTVDVVALSMGAALAIDVVARNPDRVRGLVLVNPYVRDPRLAMAGVLRVFVHSVRGVGNDVKKPGADEICNERIPVRTLVQVHRLHRLAARELPSVTQPLLVMRSDEDHTVDASNAKEIMDRAGSAQKELVRLTNSYHVATLDYDADVITERTLAFVRASRGGGSTDRA
jgi:carboxylesterase